MTMQQEAHQMVDALSVNGLTRLFRVMQTFDDTDWSSRPIIKVSMQTDETDIDSQPIATVSIQEDETKRKRIERKRAAVKRLAAMRKRTNLTDKEIEQALYEGIKEKYGEFLS